MFAFFDITQPAQCTLIGVTFGPPHTGSPMRRGSQLTVTGSQRQRFCAAHRPYRSCATALADILLTNIINGGLILMREITRYFACALTAQGPLEVEGPWAIAQLPIWLIRPCVWGMEEEDSRCCFPVFIFSAAQDINTDY